MHNHRTGRVAEVLAADKVAGEVLVVGLAPAALAAPVAALAALVEDAHPP